MAIDWTARDRPVAIAPLVTFRITFGLLMFLSLLRFWARGWITDLYVNPSFHFTYWGFEWVQPLGDTGMHLLFFALMAASLLIALGLFYRVAIVFFFLGFTYVELIDVTTYLNHYYFISLVAFLLIWLPANRHFALDARLGLVQRRLETPAWTIGILRLQLGLVYVFAGLAKLNADWLLRAEPMKTWLPAKSHLPLVGQFMYDDWVAYLFSWFGAGYDLFIVFFLLNRRTRSIAYGFVLVFHLATALFFPAIGVFPYVMIVSSLIFFSGEFHDRLLSFLPAKKEPTIGTEPYRFAHRKLTAVLTVAYFALQLLIPLRYSLYPGNLFWTEEGYRFSWRVMLMEKAGAAYFTVKDQAGQKSYAVNNTEYLTLLQEKMMSTQPDLILKYAHYLAEVFKNKGIAEPKVFAEVYVTLNGEPSRLYLDSTVDLAAEKLRWNHYDWILPYEQSTP
ncbi:HTTM domain-containing protein [Persicitalea jodogahamensis]|uniref:Type I deoxyribonuclease HsdR n=1 Tax=Persicitalea jodogahamensis TaxID=402147 RepID=A0A8J3D4U1_9BACT|nr:HTTM domain-containing protein [Persicitalea jodogahamensis]GHB73432.1 type I deoxyribonuclease HsdR [Persicitalea jodogahamensis]